MKQVQFGAFGVPSQVGRCVEVPDVSEPAANEIVFEVLAFPINPADLSFMTGRYASQPPLPATPGAEGIGRVLKVGAAVTDLKPGDRIISLLRENWTQRRRIAADQAIKVRDDIPLEQAAMLRINPPTALLLLEDIVNLQPGDWIVQNGANSAVGKILIGLARERGIRTVNVVRRPELAGQLEALGADAVVVDDGGDLAGRVRAAAGNEPVRLAIDCVGGQATRKLVDAVCDGGTVCVYGGLAGEDSTAPTHALVFRGVTVTGFMLGRFLMRRNRAQITALYELLAQRIADGRIAVPVEKIYPIEDIALALKHSEDYGRDGKILVAPNGKLR
ncbi:MAG: zinc-dependent alcohol dehydrogenase family protein [Reyranellaceae bacterium]